MPTLRFLRDYRLQNVVFSYLVSNAGQAASSRPFQGRGPARLWGCQPHWAGSGGFVKAYLNGLYRTVIRIIGIMKTSNYRTVIRIIGIMKISKCLQTSLCSLLLGFWRVSDRSLPSCRQVDADTASAKALAAMRLF